MSNEREQHANLTNAVADAFEDMTGRIPDSQEFAEIKAVVRDEIENKRQ